MKNNFEVIFIILPREVFHNDSPQLDLCNSYSDEKLKMFKIKLKSDLQ